jgi:hypothetical protein
LLSRDRPRAAFGRVLVSLRGIVHSGSSTTADVAGGPMEFESRTPADCDEAARLNLVHGVLRS